VLGLENIVSSPWSDEVAAYVTFAELEELLPGVDARFVEKAATLGLLEVEGDRLRVPSPRLLHPGPELLPAVGRRGHPVPTATGGPTATQHHPAPALEKTWLPGDAMIAGSLDPAIIVSPVDPAMPDTSRRSG
jgi:hypothetical protein